MNITTIKGILKKEQPILKSRFLVKKIGVFGSYSRGEQHKTSDIDILVEFYEAPSFFKFIELENHLSGLLHTKVDLVMKDTLKLYIGKQILKEVMYI